jgi:hypothetical protein
MTTPPPDPKDFLIPITPADQRRAAELLQAAILGEGELIDVLLAEAAAEGIARALALTAVLTRWTTLALVEQHGRDGALRLIEGTRLDAALAEVPPDDDVDVT